MPSLVLLLRRRFLHMSQLPQSQFRQHRWSAAPIAAPAVASMANVRLRCDIMDAPCFRQVSALLTRSTCSLLRRLRPPDKATTSLSTSCSKSESDELPAAAKARAASSNIASSSRSCLQQLP
eukprot:CAMPEP_0172827816 /NCGR_PEP_ID=MMETSP1075-20121228/20387_1 /TAXON_ID=2916 /ORGANISM="Ceratium fusus, Strain PA161109" /LENGTH=121 /DNA_ID=CAMNT_0013669691 /DNA_START=51 /DNA_END=412 /DNA_ORIENTATION=-